MAGALAGQLVPVDPGSPGSWFSYLNQLEPLSVLGGTESVVETVSAWLANGQEPTSAQLWEGAKPGNVHMSASCLLLQVLKLP